MAPQPRTSTIAIIVAIVGGPPAESHTDEAVVKPMAVVDEFIVVMAFPVLALPIVTTPCGWPRRAMKLGMVLGHYFACSVEVGDFEGALVF